MDRTLILVKPDAFARGLTGEILARFERKGLRIAAMRAACTVDAGARRAALRRARGQAVLRRARRVHHLRPARRAGARGPRGRQGRAPGDRRDEPARGRAGLDPRRLRARGRPEHGPRLGLDRVRRARGRAVLPGALSLTRRLVLASRSPQRRGDPRAARRRLRRSWPASRGADGRRRPSAVRASRTRGARRGRRRTAARRPLGARRRHRRRPRRARSTGKPADEAEARATLRALVGPHARGRLRAVRWSRSGGDDARRRRDRGHLPRARRRPLDWYVATGEWRERAGGYAIQGRGAALVAGHRGRLPQRRRAAGARC